MHRTLLVYVLVAGCSTAPVDPSVDAPFARPSMTVVECTAAGGMLVGDIGDGAIHRPDYRCPNGQAPIGTVLPPGDYEGAACCR